MVVKQTKIGPAPLMFINFLENAIVLKTVQVLPFTLDCAWGFFSFPLNS